MLNQVYLNKLISLVKRGIISVNEIKDSEYRIAVINALNSQ